MPKTNDYNMGRAALMDAAGVSVEIHKVASPRCFASYPDNEFTRRLAEDYDRGHLIGISPKAFMAAYTKIMTRCWALKQGAL